MGRRATPLAVRFLHEGALGRGDLAELSVDNRDRAARGDETFDRLIAERLLVTVALAVAVEDPADGRVAPVDDAHARCRIEVLPRSDEDVAPALLARTMTAAREHGLLEAEMTEVRALPIDGARGALAAMRAEGAEVVHLLEERGEVLRLRGGREVSELEEAPIVVGERLGHARARRRLRWTLAVLAGPRRRRFGTERSEDDLEQAHLFAHDARSVRVVFEAGYGDELLVRGARIGVVERVHRGVGVPPSRRT